MFRQPILQKISSSIKASINDFMMEEVRHLGISRGLMSSSNIFKNETVCYFLFYRVIQYSNEFL